MVEEMADTVIATETEVTVADQGKKTHGRDSTRATATKRILASCGGIKLQQDTIWFVLWWVSRVFSLSSLHTRGKRFFMLFTR